MVVLPSVVACGSDSGQETAARVVTGGTNGTDTGNHWVLLKMVRDSGSV